MKYFFSCILLFCLPFLTMAQVEEDSTDWKVAPPPKIAAQPAQPDTLRPQDADSSVHLERKWVPIPRKATIRSAIVPGWGQAYNRSYWKIPIVYAALGTTAYVFTDNLKTYRDLKKAYANRLDGDPNNDDQIPDYLSILPNESIRYNRDQFRRYIDYSVLFFLFFWGLNVVDATVDAHLQGFDVSRDLSLQVRPGFSPVANTTGLSLVLKIGKNPPKNVFSLR